MPLRTIRRTLLSIALTIAVIAIVADAFCVVVDKIVAVVNSEVITQHETTQLLIPIYEQYRKEYTGKRLENKMLEAEDMVLKQLIDDKLILSEAKVQDIRAADKEIERKLETVKSRFETDEAFRSALAEQNLTLSELRERFRGDIIKGKLVRRQMGLNVTITPIEVRKYYDEHIDDFREPAKAKVLNILIKKDGRTEGTGID